MADRLAVRGPRLKPVSLAVTVDGKSIAELCALPIGELAKRLLKLELSDSERQIAARILAEVGTRLGFLLDPRAQQRANGAGRQDAGGIGLPGAGARSPQRCSIVVVITTTMLHRCGRHGAGSTSGPRFFGFLEYRRAGVNAWDVRDYEASGPGLALMRHRGEERREAAEHTGNETGGRPGEIALAAGTPARSPDRGPAVPKSARRNPGAHRLPFSGSPAAVSACGGGGLGTGR